MKRAERLSAPLREKHSAVTITASVIVRGEDVMGEGINNPIHNSFCPRTVFQCPSGEGYELCPRSCHSDNHSEKQAIKQAEKNGKETKGADLYLYGHWWCCKPCWDAMIKAGIKNVYLVEGATEKFFSAVSGKVEQNKPLRYYAAAALTRSENDTQRTFHEEAARLLSRVSIEAYLPWQKTDPLEHPNFTPKEVYKKNSEEIKKSDFVLAHLGEPSLGVGIEIELAAKYKTPVIAFAPEGASVSRMALGAPSVSSFFTFRDMKDFMVRLSESLSLLHC